MQLLTQVVKTPAGTETDLPLDELVMVHPLLKIKQRVSYLLLQRLTNGHLVFTCK